MKRIVLITLIAMFATALNAQDAGDWANYGRYAEANAALTETPDVVFMGNSITEGWAYQHPAFFTEHNFVGRGISGQVTAQMLARFQSDVIALSPEKVVILAGINDIAENNGPVPIPEIAHNIISMCQLALFNDIEPIIISVLPADGFPWRREIKNVAEMVKSLNGLLREWATASDCTYVDMWSPLANDRGGLSPELATDGIHPTSAAYDMMESMILPHICE
jgi:lysophospholipase L1-like esterase